MTQPTLDVRRLRLLVELSRRGTIAAVAQALAYSPSAVSQQLTVLEMEAGTRLTEPVGRRVRLTPAGELLVTHAERIFRELELAAAALEAANGTISGPVRLAAFQSAMLTLVPAALITLRAAHPDLRVEVTELEPEVSLPALAAGEFDVALAEEYPHRPQPRLPGIEREDLLDDNLELVVPAAWTSSSLTDLADTPFAMEPRGTAARDWADTVCRSAGFEPHVTCTSSDLQIHLRLVDLGLAAALLPQLAGAASHRQVRTIALPQHPVRRVFAATRVGSAERPALRAVIDTVRAAR